jgi:hypothetical protein
MEESQIVMDNKGNKLTNHNTEQTAIENDYNEDLADRLDEYISSSDSDSLSAIEDQTANS